jgi:uncharacterized repeat protein (TIGR01451 family)
VNGKIAYASRDAVSTNIWVMNADGSNRTYLTSSTDTEQEPAFSPDGTRIAYMRQLGNNPEVWVMNADGSGQTNLSQRPGFDTDPDWSPDGSKIAFTSYRDGYDQIYLMNPDGSGQTNLSRVARWLGRDPSWSPDGSKIAFTVYRPGYNGEIYAMNADGTAPTNLTQLIDTDFGPSWQVVPSADLALSLVASSAVARANKPLTYTTSVEDLGPSNAAGVVVTDDLTSDRQFVSVTPSARSATVAILVKVMAPRKSAVSNTASVASATPDPYLANNSATITTPVK